jgi:predicted XRE-type DNA-binding protein
VTSAKPKFLRETEVSNYDHHKVSSGNVFADLGLADADELNTKSLLAIKIGRTIKARKLTQTAAAAVLGIDQPKISNLLRGRLEIFSVERLCEFLTKLGYDVDINVSEHSAKGQARLTVSID